MNKLDLIEKTLITAQAAFNEAKKDKRFKESQSRGYGGDVTMFFDDYVERTIVQELKNYVGTILTEEKGIIDGHGKGIAIIDPVDGSTNTARDLPFCASTIAIANGNEFKDVVAAGTIDLIRGELFLCDGERVLLNGKEVKTSNTKDLNDVIASIDVKLTKENLKFVNRLNKILESVRYIRFLGAIALDTAYVAAGRLDAFIAPTPRVRFLDLVGGLFMIKVAGGYVEVMGEEIDRMKLLDNKRIAVLGINNIELAKKIKAIMLEND
ncbi:MAG TPA: inositol monophosphatase family protein [Geobacterales bacterium]|nr:inositol monophosphatase family protein [Geobacterales bacterium]